MLGKRTIGGGGQLSGVDEMRLPNAVLDKLRKNDELALWAGPASSVEVAQAESDLSVEFPDDYRAFLTEFGSGVFGTADLFGIERTDDRYWDVVSQTAREREFGPLPPSYVVISHDGQGNHYCLDCARGTVIWVTPRVTELERIEEPAAESYTEFLSGVIEEQLSLAE
jgi:cell wall assembly regulator SMI1